MPKTITQEQIDRWKAQYGDVYKITVEDKEGYLRKPDRKILAYVGSIGQNPIKAAETMLNSCWLGGDEEIKANDACFLGASQKLGALIEIKAAELSKL